MSYPSEFISVFARNCSVRRIEATVARAFLTSNHRYGFSRARYHYGIFIKRQGGGLRDASGQKFCPVGTMVAAGSFSAARRWLKDEGQVLSYEWVRYASLKGVRVLGGMGKMLKAFIAEVNPDDIMSYAPLAGSEVQKSKGSAQKCSCNEQRRDDGSSLHQCWEEAQAGEVYTLLGFKLEGVKEFAGGRSAKYRLRLKHSV